MTKSIDPIVMDDDKSGARMAIVVATNKTECRMSFDVSSGTPGSSSRYRDTAGA